ncbi:glycosyltransferase [Enterovibrio calviensis]|uniref:glycosyltransferase n=1 Tax=Enterovibrio calviensis TaxID=91359 RepID=UPI00373600C6
MIRVFINGLNSKSGGGKSILDNYLQMLEKNTSNVKYYVLTPSAKEYDSFNSDSIEIVDIQDIYKKLYMVYPRYEYALPKLVKKIAPDVIFNLSDVPIKIDGVRQVFLFDWSYAIYPESPVWDLMDSISCFERKLKVYFFRKYASHVTTIIAQTETVRSRLLKYYGFDDVRIIPNAVSLENLNGGSYKDFKLGDGKKLLCLSVYFPHKNLEVFIPLAKQIKEKKLDYKIVLTIDESQHRKVKDFLGQVKSEGLEDIIKNIGPVTMNNVPSLYKQCDALLLPTLLESFGLTYIEAMSNSVPILTSDFDFSRDVCGDVALYFDPFDSDDILEKINILFSDCGSKERRLAFGRDRLNNLLTWEDVLDRYSKLILERNDENE